MRLIGPLAVAAVFCLAVPAAAFADDTTNYNLTLTSTNGGTGGSGYFTYDATTSSITAVDITLDNDEFTIANDFPYPPSSNADGSNFSYTGNQSLLFGDQLNIAGGAYNLYGFPEGNPDSGTLTVSPAVAATPEPSSLAMLGTGIVGAAGVLRRRFASAS